MNRCDYYEMCAYPKRRFCLEEPDDCVVYSSFVVQEEHNRSLNNHELIHPEGLEKVTNE